MTLISNDQLSEHDLLARWADGRDQAAFAELVHRTVGWVQGAAAAKLGGDISLAEEATQRAYAMLAKKAANLRHHPCLRAWLHRAVTLEATAVARQEGRQKKKMLAMAEASQTLPYQNPMPLLPDADLLDALHASLERLPTDDQTNLTLRHVEGRSFREIGQLLGKSEAAAQKQGARALEKLAESLGRRKSRTVTLVAMGGLLPLAASAKSMAALASYPATLVAGALRGAGEISLQETLIHTLKMMTYGKKTTLGLAALFLAAGMTGSFTLGRHQAMAGGPHSLPPAAAIPSTAPKARPRPARPAAEVVFSAQRDLRTRLENLSRFLAVDPATDLFSPGFPFDFLNKPNPQAIADLVALTPQDLPEALKLLKEWQSDRAKFEGAAMALAITLADTMEPAAVVKRLLEPDFQGTAGRPPQAALNQALKEWSRTAPEAAWGLYYQLTQAGQAPVGWGSRMLPALVESNPAAALTNIAKLPPEWHFQSRSALGDVFANPSLRTAALEALKSSTGDDSLANLSLGAVVLAGTAAARETLDILATRNWQQPDGLSRAVARVAPPRPNGNLDARPLTSIAAHLGQLATPEANERLFQAVRQSLATLLEIAGPTNRERLLSSVVADRQARLQMSEALK